MVHFILKKTKKSPPGYKKRVFFSIVEWPCKGSLKKKNHWTQGCPDVNFGTCVAWSHVTICYLRFEQSYWLVGMAWYSRKTRGESQNLSWKTLATLAWRLTTTSAVKGKIPCAGNSDSCFEYGSVIYHEAYMFVIHWQWEIHPSSLLCGVCGICGFDPSWPACFKVGLKDHLPLTAQENRLIWSFRKWSQNDFEWWRRIPTDQETPIYFGVDAVG